MKPNAGSPESVYMKKKDISRIKKDPSLMTVKFDFGETVPAPVKTGDSLGKATFSYQNKVWFTADMIAQSDVDVTGRIPTEEEPITAVTPSDVTADTKRQGIPLTIAVNAGILLLAFVLMLPLIIKKKK